MSLARAEAEDQEQGYQSCFWHGGRIRDSGVLGLVTMSSATAGSGVSGVPELPGALVLVPSEGRAWLRWPARKSNFRFEGRVDSSVRAWVFDGPN